MFLGYKSHEIERASREGVGVWTNLSEFPEMRRHEKKLSWDLKMGDQTLIPIDIFFVCISHVMERPSHGGDWF